MEDIKHSAEEDSVPSEERIPRQLADKAIGAFSVEAIETTASKGLLQRLIRIRALCAYADGDSSADIQKSGLSEAALAQLENPKGKMSLKTWGRAFNGSIQNAEEMLRVVDRGDTYYSRDISVIVDVLDSIFGILKYDLESDARGL